MSIFKEKCATVGDENFNAKSFLETFLFLQVIKVSHVSPSRLPELSSARFGVELELELTRLPQQNRAEEDGSAPENGQAASLHVEKRRAPFLFS